MDDEAFSLEAYIDSLGPMTRAQRSIIRKAMKRARRYGDSPAFLRDTALYLVTLVLVGGVTTLDDDAWEVVDSIRAKHDDGAAGL
ncbi:hypothetical protein [Cellulosimicrobium cellulans]|uniref:hypothetical protein n=1 Tax=Cellulosimicrobium cellulans TaxID=1710 RepID=UPI0024057207|nr:hypothetical protein [Cellulosimicrobium cellulans]MDF9877150.1 hypothetical protein [Cellulosimicrobium cellulans]